jgi:hypothetical protein
MRGGYRGFRAYMTTIRLRADAADAAADARRVAEPVPLEGG